LGSAQNPHVLGLASQRFQFVEQCRLERARESRALETPEHESDQETPEAGESQPDDKAQAADELCDGQEPAPRDPVGQHPAFAGLDQHDLVVDPHQGQDRQQAANEEVTLPVSFHEITVRIAG